MPDIVTTGKLEEILSDNWTEVTAHGYDFFNGTARSLLLQAGFSLKKRLDAAGGWKIETQGRARQDIDKPWASFYSAQLLSSDFILLSYVFESDTTKWRIDKQENAYNLTVDGHAVANIPSGNVNFFLEKNNFAAIAAVIFMIKNDYRDIQNISVLASGTIEALNIPINICDSTADIFGMTFLLDCDGLVISARDKGQAFVERNQNLLSSDHSGCQFKIIRPGAQPEYPVSRLTFQIPSPAGTLTATLARKAETASASLVIFLGGTGRHTRDGFTLTALNAGYGRLMDAVAWNGQDTLRFDRYPSLTATIILTHEQICEQARAVVSFARTVLNYSNIMIVGHSYGGILAAALAADDTSLRRVVLVSTPSRSIAESIEWQRQLILERLHDADSRAAFQQAAAQFDAVIEDDDKDISEKTFLERASVLFLRSVRKVQIKDFLQKSKCEFKIIHGLQDEQVPSSDAVELDRYLHAINRNSQLSLIDNFGHRFVPVAGTDYLLFDKKLSDAILSN